ncbi:MAG: oligoendopeptidase F, partial [Bacillaceae bacterium]|nr:oligoendopeptidase F [Bacillaceae bacterium]
MAKEKVKTLPKRSEVPVEYTWRLEDIFPTDEDWEREFGEIKKLLPKAQEFKGTLGESAGRLLELLRFQEQVYFRLGKLYTYAHMRYDQDTTNQFYQGLNARANTLHTEAASAFSFVVPEILSIPEEKIERFLEENQELRLYRHYFDKINLKRPHVLSPEVEEVLA